MAYDFNLEFQRDILRLLVHDARFLLGFHRAVDPDYFTDPVYGTIARGIHRVFASTGTPPSLGSCLQAVKEEALADQDEVSLEAEIRGIYEAGLPADAAYVESNVLAFSKRQRLQDVLLRGPDYLTEGDFGGFEDAVREALSLTSGADNPVYDYFERLPERLAAAHHRAGEAIGTGIQAIDRHLPDGGLAPGEMGLFMGLPGFGKSTTLVNVGAHALLQGKRVFHATIGDMTERKVGSRYDCRLTRRTEVECRMDPKGTGEALREVLNASGGLDRLKIQFWPSGRLTVPDLERHLLWLRARYGWSPDVLVVDYAANMASRKDYKDALRLAHEEIYKDLRSLGGALACRVWSAIQANRAGASEKVLKMENAAEAFGPMRDADVVVTINMSMEERDQGIIKFHGAKVRDFESQWLETCGIDWKTHTVRPLDDFEGNGHGV